MESRLVQLQTHVSPIFIDRKNVKEIDLVTQKRRKINKCEANRIFRIGFPFFSSHSKIPHCGSTPVDHDGRVQPKGYTTDKVSRSTFLIFILSLLFSHLFYFGSGKSVAFIYAFVSFFVHEIWTWHVCAAAALYMTTSTLEWCACV